MVAKGWVPDAVWHGWVGEPQDGYVAVDMSEHIICWKATGKRPEGRDLHTVRTRANITCEECLEWLHA